MTKLFQ